MSEKELILLFIKRDEIKNRLDIIRPINDEIERVYKENYDRLYNSDGDTNNELKLLYDERSKNIILNEYSNLCYETIKNSIVLNNIFVVNMSLEDVDLIKKFKTCEIDISKYENK